MFNFACDCVISFSMPFADSGHSTGRDQLDGSEGDGRKAEEVVFSNQRAPDLAHAYHRSQVISLYFKMYLFIYLFKPISHA